MASQPKAQKSRPIAGVPARAIVVASPQGSVQFATDRAANWLKAGFGVAGPLKRLPHSIVRWLDESARAGQAKPFMVSDPAMRLRIDLLHTEANSCCLLLEKSSGRRPIAAAQGRPLTRREAEVLAWVARGKSNAEVAAILRVCTKTVDKHLERIYPKLGVENRTAAASHAASTAGA